MACPVGLVIGQDALPKEEWVQQELKYVEELQNLRMPDYADKIMANIKSKYPDVAARMKVMELQGLLAMGKFDKVLEVIKKEPDQKNEATWAMKLALGDGYYAWGKYKEAKEIYDSFFAAYPGVPPQAINDFYLDSAHKYAQMLMRMGENEAALQAYNNALKAQMERYKRRQLQIERAELMVNLAEARPENQRQEYYTEIEKICTEIFWVQDIWFGKAIVIMAHVKVMKGDVAGAMKLVDGYWSQLKDIDNQLKEQAKADDDAAGLVELSPVAECRYLVGVIMENEANRLIASGKGERSQIIKLLVGEQKEGKQVSSGALQHFLNAFVQYPDTQWAPAAAEHFKTVKDTLAKAGIKVNPKIPADAMAKVRAGQFQQGQTLFNRQEYDKAAETYISVLNLFPEGMDSISALSRLVECYVKSQEEGAKIYADMVEGYLAERFGKNKTYMLEAGNQILRLAVLYDEEKMTERKDAVYNLFFAHFPGHPKAAGMLMQFGNQKFSEGKTDEAMSYYTRIEQEHVGAPVYASALSRIADILEKAKDYVGEIKILSKLVKNLEAQHEPGHALIKAKWRIAYAYKQLGDKYIAVAANKFSELCKILSTEGAKYEKSAEEKEANTKILAGAMFYKAYCFSRVTQPEDKVKAYKTHAASVLEELVAKFPDSQFAPAALGQLGTILTVLEKPDDARNALVRLKQKYPKSPEAMNSTFILAGNLLNMGRKQEAVKLFKEMFEGEGTYSPGQILTAGKELLNAGEYDTAAEAFERILASKESGAWQEKAMLMKGEALFKKGNLEEAIKVLTDLQGKFPKSSGIVEASELLSEAYAELGSKEQNEDKRLDLFNNSILAMKAVRQRTTTLPERANLDLKVARILLRRSNAERDAGKADRAAEALAQSAMTYQSIILFSDAAQPEMKPYFEAAYYEGTPLLMELDKWEDALENCVQYLKMFPEHQHASEIRVWYNKAKTRASATGVEGVIAPAEGAKEEIAPVADVIETNSSIESVPAELSPTNVSVESTGEQQ